jgi:nucleotide-binding universal stress UspA family protein
MYRNILVPVDLSHEETTRRILELGKHLCSEDGKLTVVHVLPEIPTYVATYVPEDVKESREKDQRDLLDRAVAEAGVSKATVYLTHGAPHLRILDMIDEVKPDLVIIGSHRPGLSDYFLGSTAGRVVRHAGCSVLVDR